MTMRDNLDISAYLVLGPENTLGRPVADVVEQALDAGFTCVQIRSKVCSVRDLIEYTAQAADVIARAGKSDQVALLIDDRLDAVLAARERGIKCDGVHVGQSDIPVDVCRKLLGPDAIVGLSARCEEMLEYVKTADMSLVDYLGVGPLHETATKKRRRSHLRRQHRHAGFRRPACPARGQPATHRSWRRREGGRSARPQGHGRRGVLRRLRSLQRARSARSSGRAR